MTYTPTTWADEVPASSPVKYTIRTSGGTILYDDVQIDVKTSITTPGTAVNAANLNHIEQGIQTLENATPPKVFQVAGDLFVGSGSGAGARMQPGTAVANTYEYALINDNNATNKLRWAINVYHAYVRASTQAISNATTTIVDFSAATEGSLDPDGYISITTGANWRATFGKPNGVYLVTTAVCFESTANWTAGEIAYLDLFKNGSLHARLDRKDDTVTGVTSALFLKGAILIRATTNDYIDIRVRQESGGSLNLVGDGSHNWIRITKIR